MNGVDKVIDACRQAAAATDPAALYAAQWWNHAAMLTCVAIVASAIVLVVWLNTRNV